MLLYRGLLVAICSALVLSPSPASARIEGLQEVLGNKWRPSAESPGPDFVPSDEQRTRFNDLGGNDVVHATWHQLRQEEETRGDKARSSALPAFIETAWHYVRLVIRWLFMNGGTKTYASSPKQALVLSGSLGRKVHLLKHAAALNDSDSMFLLAEMSFYGNFSHPRDYHQAFKFYNQLASTSGNSTAQHMLGFMYATGIGQAVDRDQARALMYHIFAAEQGDIKSEMTLGFRYHSGIGTASDCERAAHFYKRVADKSIAYWKSGPPAGRDLIRESFHWADESGGIYGEGASASSSGLNANRDGSNAASPDDVKEYLDMLARKGDLKATFSLAKMHYDDSKMDQRQFRTARRLFTKITRQYWDKHGKIIAGGSKGIDRIAAKAAAYIGRMYLRGEGLEQSYEKAANWFRRGIANGDPHCQYLMGLVYRDGLGVPKDPFKAASYLKVAADENVAAAQSSLGVLFLDQGEVETASRYFELAARNGHPEAFYYLAEFAHKGIGRERQCGTATASYKIVAESIEEIHSSFAEANDAYERGDLESAVVASMMAAEQGYETAQANTAYLLDEQRPVLQIPSTSALGWTARRLVSSVRDVALALAYWTRSAKQANIDSLLKMGDYYLFGFGITVPDTEKASICYHTAAETYHSAQALWNLGWMHENGVAVEQDFHMAKRYYDLALEMNLEAYLPVKLALAKLRTRSYWNTVTGGNINSIRAELNSEFDDEGANSGRKLTLTEWIRKFIEYSGDEDYEAGEAAAGRGSTAGPDGLVRGNADDDDGGSGAGIPSAEDPSSYYYDDMVDVDNGFVETLIIIGLAATLAFLVYYRHQRRLQQQQQQQQQRREVVEDVGENNANAIAAAPGQGLPQPTGAAAGDGGDRGFFPNPGDPDYPAWAAGGVGH